MASTPSDAAAVWMQSAKEDAASGTAKPEKVKLCKTVRLALESRFINLEQTPRFHLQNASLIVVVVHFFHSEVLVT